MIAPVSASAAASVAAPSPRFHAYADVAACAQALTDLLLNILAAAAAPRASTRAQPTHGLALLSGGDTPVPIYRALAARRPDWSGVELAPVDERWVAEDAAGSNARLLRETLAAGSPGGPAFWPLAGIDAGIDAAVAKACHLYAQALARGPLLLVLLGMGEDGHTASLFPGSPDLPAALAQPAPYSALDAAACPGAGSWPTRITLTPAGWAPARHRWLLLRGAAKRRRFEQALQSADPLLHPVSAAIRTGTVPLDVHWCP